MVEASHWFARLYDIIMVAADRVGLARRRRWLASEAQSPVLEIGAGTGLQFSHYAAGTSVYAVEPDVAMVQRARRRQQQAAARISLVVADAQALPFRDGAFQAAVCALTFCTIAEPGIAARELRRVLQPTGRAYLLEHVRARHPVLARAQEALTPIWSHVAGGCHLARCTAHLFEQSGFDVDIRRESLDGALIEMVARPAPDRSGGIAPATARSG